MITASQLYDFVKCPHRTALDAFGDQSLRDQPNPFIQLLWDQGVDHEDNIVSSLDISEDLRQVPLIDRERETLKAIKKRAPLIYGGRLTSGDLLGEPDLLQLRSCGYIPGDIKSGSGLEGDDNNGKLKKHYAYQLAHYVLILDQLGLGDSSKEAFVIDRHGEQVPYVLTEPQSTKNPETWWDSYLQALENVRTILGQTQSTLGALCKECELCHWHSYCTQDLVKRDDLTLIAGLGRSKRDTMIQTVPTIRALAGSDPDSFIRGKKTVFPGIGSDTLIKFHQRARLLSTPGAVAYLKTAVHIPVATKEVYFDIEADPIRDIVYLHGFVERLHGEPATATFISFFAEGPDPACEEAIFQQGWEYLKDRIQDSIVYYYSKYERTAYKKLAEKYPNVCSIDEVETLFALPVMVDLLYDVVVKATEWPTYDRSIKTLAKHLGFQWRGHTSIRHSIYRVVSPLDRIRRSRN